MDKKYLEGYGPNGTKLDVVILISMDKLGQMTISVMYDSMTVTLK